MSQTKKQSTIGGAHKGHGRVDGLLRFGIRPNALVVPLDVDFHRFHDARSILSQRASLPAHLLQQEVSFVVFGQWRAQSLHLHISLLLKWNERVHRGDCVFRRLLGNRRRIRMLLPLSRILDVALPSTHTLSPHLRPILRLGHSDVEPFLVLLRVHPQVKLLAVCIDLRETRYLNCHLHPSILSANWDRNEGKGLDKLVVDQKLEYTHNALVLCLGED